MLGIPVDQRAARRLVLLTIALAVMVPSLAAAQSIAGVVRDASGAVLPGVTVEAASPALIEKVRTAVSDGTGQYRIENLTPGTYKITYTLPGFTTVEREGVQVSDRRDAHAQRRPARRRRAGNDHRHGRDAGGGRAEQHARAACARATKSWRRCRRRAATAIC